MHRLTVAICLALFARASLAAPQPEPNTPVDNAKPVSATAAPPSYLAGRGIGESPLWEPVKVIGQRLFPYQEGLMLEQRYIDEQAKGNGDIGTLLRINPNVQFDDTAATSRNMGEIRPADISINGGLYYQNAFLLDGASFNNDLDPASNNPNHFADPPSHAQGVAIDTSLIGSLTVYDSNVPASFGGFNGGVVVAESRKAQDDLAGKISYRMTKSDWNQLHINAAYRETFENSTGAANQPLYDKYQVNVMLEGRTKSGVGLIGNLTRTRSVIALRGYPGGESSPADANSKDQERQNTAISLRADWDSGSGLQLEASALYAPTDERYFIQNTKDSWFDLKQGGPLLSLRATLEQGAWTWKNTLSYSDMDSSRRSDVDYWYSWRWSQEKNWASSTTGLSQEGNWGNVDQTNRSTAYKLEADRDALRWGRWEHRLQWGVEASQRKATYERLRDFDSYITPAATTTCTNALGAIDTVACSLSPTPSYANRGQALTRHTTYLAGDFEAESTDWSVFAQDDIRLGRWSFRPGVRVDGSSLVKDVTLAPRLAMSWDIFGNQRSLLTAGLNRYYGRNLFAYKLREGRERLTLVQTRSATGANRLVWSAPVQDASATRFEELDVPYSDELALGFNQVWGNFDINAKYVRRRMRDEIMRVRLPSQDTSGYYATNVYEYRNVGRAENDTWTLSVGTRDAWNWGPSATTAQFAFDYTDTRRAYTGASQDYSTNYDDEDYNAIIRYQGEIMRYYDIPASSYNRPWTARLATQTRLDDWGLQWSNFLRYRAGYLGVAVTGLEDYQGQSIRVYEDYKFPNSFTWDTVLEYSLALPREQELYWRVEVQNVLDRKTLIDGLTASASYEPGRTYWLEMGYRF